MRIATSILVAASSNRGRNLTQWLCGLYWLVLTAGLLRPRGGDRPSGIELLDSHPDLSHCLAFMILAVLVRAARFGWSTGTMMLTLSVYAAGAELAQMLVPGRTASPVDGLANLLGVWLGAALCSAASRLLRPCPPLET